MFYALLLSVAIAAPAGVVSQSAAGDHVTVDANGMVVPSVSLPAADSFVGDAAKGSGGGGKKPKDDETDVSDDSSEEEDESKGGCSAIGGAPALVGAAFGLVAALRRRRQS
jgi:uncharacterized protein (TIGR03382 family)